MNGSISWIAPKNTTAVMGLPIGRINDLDNRVTRLESGSTPSVTINNVYELALGTCDGSNRIFFVEHLPKYIDINGLTYFVTDAYTISGPTSYVTPSESTDGIRTVFTFVDKMPSFVTMNTIDYFNGDGYTLTSSGDNYIVTFDVPPANGATIYGYVGTLYQITVDATIAPLPNSVVTSFFDTNMNVETPSGTIDGSNTIFTVSNTPKWVVVNGRKYYSGDGYTYSAPTITLDALITPPVGSTLRSIY